MTILNINKIKEEILNLIRNGDIFSTTQRNVTTETENIVGVAGNIVTLSNIGVKNIRSFKIDSVPKTLYVDYDINIYNKSATESQIINLTDALVGGEDVEVVYDYSSDSDKGDRIYPDFPEDFLGVGSFPRIGFEIDSIKPTNRSTNDTLIQENVLINFITIAVNKDVENYDNAVYKLLFDNRKSMQCNNLMRPSGRSGKDNYKKVGTTILYHKMFSYTLPAEFEK